MGMSETEKEIFYRLLIDLFFEKPRLSAAEREKRRKISDVSKKLDEKGREVLKLEGNVVTETTYCDDPTTSDLHYDPNATGCRTGWTRPGERITSIMHSYDLEKKKVQRARPDLVEWANTLRERIKEIEDEEK
jgi:hypothetical protein